MIERTRGKPRSSARSDRYGREARRIVESLPHERHVGVRRLAHIGSMTMTERSAVLSALEHTLLAATATDAAIDRLCEEAVAHGLFGVCVNPCYIARCRARLQGTAVRVVTVVGFPLSSSFEACVRLECQLALEAGADEIDSVMRLGAAKSGAWREVERDARGLVEACAGRPVKLILETAVLEGDELEHACHAALAAGVAFVKTSSGYAARGATVEDVTRMRRAVAGRARIKASGGIRNLESVRALMAAGADRIGTSAGAAIAVELAAIS
jgi:deoxyribose-phosphate aldolase